MMLQYINHAIERCDATTGHAVLPIAYCRDTATARMLVDAANSCERVLAENSKLRETLRELCRDYESCSATVYDKATGQSLIELTRPAIKAARAALAEGGGK